MTDIKIEQVTWEIGANLGMGDVVGKNILYRKRATGKLKLENGELEKKDKVSVSHKNAEAYTELIPNLSESTSNLIDFEQFSGEGEGWFELNTDFSAISEQIKKKTSLTVSFRLALDYESLGGVEWERPSFVFKLVDITDKSGLNIKDELKAEGGSYKTSGGWKQDLEFIDSYTFPYKYEGTWTLESNATYRFYIEMEKTYSAGRFYPGGWRGFITKVKAI
jgi:hypothetical protein